MIDFKKKACEIRDKVTGKTFFDVIDLSKMLEIFYRETQGGQLTSTADQLQPSEPPVSIQCKCTTEETWGSTEQMCCNRCGLPTGETWNKSSAVDMTEPFRILDENTTTVSGWLAKAKNRSDKHEAFIKAVERLIRDVQTGAQPADVRQRAGDAAFALNEYHEAHNHKTRK